MSIEQSIEQGEFEAALALLGQSTAGPQPDPGQVLMTFNMEVRLQRFAAAEATMRRLISLAPQVAGVMITRGPGRPLRAWSAPAR
jgi:hypothetical protein